MATATATPAVRFTATLPPARRPPWLSVRCDWCRDTPAKGYSAYPTYGCMICVRYWQELYAVVNSDEWRQWRRAMIADPVNGPLVAADWLSDLGHDTLAAALREAAMAMATTTTMTATVKE